MKEREGGRRAGGWRIVMVGEEGAPASKSEGDRQRVR